MKKKARDGGLEQALRESEDRYGEIYTNAPVGIFHSTPEGKLLDANPQFARSIGYETPAALVEAVNKGSTAALYGDPSRREAVSRQALESDQWRRFEGRYKRKDGTFGVGRMMLRSYISKKGAAPQLEGFMEDISEQRKLQDSLVRAQSLESLAQLAAGIAHQFNNINAVVTGYLEIALKAPSLPGDIRVYLESAFAAVLRGVEITQRLDILTRASPGLGPLIELEELVPQLVGRYSARALVDGIEIRMETADPSPARVDRHTLEFVVDCLMSNAWDALRDRPTRIVTVRTKTTPERSCVQISDTGCGMAAGDTHKVFTPFFTTKGEWATVGSPQKRAKGIGLSLAVCRSLVHARGGAIDFESEENQGTTVTVWFPRETET